MPGEVTRRRFKQTMILRSSMRRPSSRLISAGYIQYEISNWALPGSECRHNLGYWTGVPYRGFAESVGMSLHGSRDEIELGDDAELALAVHQELAVALHRLDAAEERDASALVDLHLPREIGRGQGHTRRLQRIQYRHARRQQRGIDVVAAAACSRLRCGIVAGSQHARRWFDDLGRIRLRPILARRGTLRRSRFRGALLRANGGFL